MKKTLTAVTAILLILSFLAGCAVPTVLPEGHKDGNAYISESAGLTFTLPEDWEYIYGMNASWVEGVPVEIYARETAGGSYTESYVVIAYEDLAKTGKTGCDEEAYFDLIKEGLRESMNENPDKHYAFSDYTDVKIGSNSFKTMTVDYTESDNLYYFIRRMGNCMICIQAQIPKGEDIGSLMANFS